MLKGPVSDNVNTRLCDTTSFLCIYIEVSHFESWWQNPCSPKLKYEHLIICTFNF